jgi:glycosyltransferase involved in cell wall biosynthesis
MSSIQELPAFSGAAAPVSAPIAGAKRIKVLHLIHSVCHGGIESALINWVRNFDRERFDVYVACFAYDRNREEAFLRAAEIAGISVLLVPWSRTKPFFKAARAVARIVRERQIDILHTHAYYADAVGAMVPLFAPVKTIATVYVWGKYELHRQLMQIMDWVALRFVDKVTAHCEDTARKTARLGFRADRVPTLIAGFPVEHDSPAPDERRALRRAAGIGDDEVLMVNVARIHPEKAHDQLLRSFRSIHDRHPNTKLWISGIGWEYLEKELLALRKTLGLDEAVEFVGFRQDLWPMLDAADFMVHPSHVEGVPIAILYGMAAGLPIVVSDVGGVFEVIKTGQTGVRVPENDVEGFADAVCGLIEDPARARALGDAARHFVRTDYSIATAVRKVEDTYYEVLGRR